MKLKKAGILTKIIITALIMYACVSLMILALRTADAILIRDQLRQQVDQTAGENEQLRYAVENADDLDVVRQIAEDKLGLVSGEN